MFQTFQATNVTISTPHFPQQKPLNTVNHVFFYYIGGLSLWVFGMSLLTLKHLKYGPEHYQPRSNTICRCYAESRTGYSLSANCESLAQLLYFSELEDEKRGRCNTVPVEVVLQLNSIYPNLNYPNIQLSEHVF